MAAHDWLRPPRQVLAIFLTVAVVSTATLGWLAVRLLQQDAQLEEQRRRERVEQAADATVGAMQQALAGLIALAAQPVTAGAPIPADVSVVTFSATALTVRPAGSLPFTPIVAPRHDAQAALFDAGEQAEYRLRDHARAARLYTVLAVHSDPAVRGGGLARLARVRRKQANAAVALDTYAVLAELGDDVSVFNLPASLVAGSGRISTLAETGRAADARAEAQRLADGLRTGRWTLLRSEYESYDALVREHLPDAPAVDPDSRARAEALEWLWNRRDEFPPTSRRLIPTSADTVLAVWQSSADAVNAVVAGPSFLRTLCSDATQTAPGLACAMSDVEGRVVMGGVPPDVNGATRAAATSNLPWTVHLYESPGQNPQPSSRDVLLLAMFAGVGLVLGAGWYFILRAISGETRVSRLQTDFVAAVSHEFRSPLTSLSHVAEMLANDRLPDEGLRRRSYGVLVRDTDRLRRLVETLLDFGRFESGNAAFRAEPADLHAIVRHTVDEFQEHVRADGYHLDLSAPPEVVHVHVDRDAFARALWNLLDNAVKYSGDSRTVRVAIVPAGESVAVTVADEGLGIPAHERGEIFERFVRGSESKARRIKGTGIGLALVRQIVRAHGGEIEVTSEVGRGSTFRLLLPVSQGGRETQPALEVTAS